MKINRLFRIVWGLVFLASVGWLIFGFSVLTTSGPNASGQGAAAEIGSAAASGAIGLTILCTGGVPALVAGLLYWRNGVAMRHRREHEETLAAMRTPPPVPLPVHGEGGKAKG